MLATGADVSTKGWITNLFSRYCLRPFGRELGISFFELFVDKVSWTPFAVVPSTKVMKSSEHCLPKYHDIVKPCNLLVFHLVSGCPKWPWGVNNFFYKILFAEGDLTSSKVVQSLLFTAELAYSKSCFAEVLDICSSIADLDTSGCSLFWLGVLYLRW